MAFACASRSRHTVRRSFSNRTCSFACSSNAHAHLWPPELICELLQTSRRRSLAGRQSSQTGRGNGSSSCNPNGASSGTPEQPSRIKKRVCAEATTDATAPFTPSGSSRRPLGPRAASPAERGVVTRLALALLELALDIVDICLLDLQARSARSARSRAVQ